MIIMAESQDKNQSIDPRELYSQLRYLQNLYSQQYEFVEDNLATYSIANNTIKKNLELLDNAASAKGSKILVNPEGGIYFEASVKEMNKIITYVGAGYLAEKSIDQAKEFLTENQKKGEEVLKKLISDKQKLENELLDINYKLAALEQQLAQQR